MSNNDNNTASCSSLYMLYDLCNVMWDVGNELCQGSGILSMCDVGDMRMSGMWNFGDLGCSGCWMMGMRDVRNARTW